VVEIVFLMLVMKLPIVYLVAVVWYAVRAEPRPLEPAVVTTRLGPTPPRPWSRRRSPSRGGGPRGGPARRPPAPRVALARGERRA
jgi:hypothetical protein